MVVLHGDVLIHAGDLTFRGTERELSSALQWLESVPHRNKLLIAGNHDWGFDEAAPRRFRGWRLDKIDVAALLARFPTLTYLQDSAVAIDGVKFHGSPLQSRFWDWAFNFSRG